MAADDQMAQHEGRIPARAADAFDEWMARFAELDDAAVDDLLRGETPVGCDDLAPIAEVAAAVRQRATARGPEIGPALRSQIQAGPHVPPRFAASARRRLRLVTAAAAALMIVGVAATQNALPAAAQRFVADAADLVGLDVPRPEEGRGQAPGDPGEPSGPTEPIDATEPSVTAGGAPSGTPGEGPSSTSGGPPEETPGGAIPADPGTPGDGEPATPATPPAPGSGGGAGNNAGGNPDSNGQVDGSGGGRETAPGQTGSRGASDQG